MDPVERDFERWEGSPPAEVIGDSIWRLPAYRLSRYLAMLVDHDVPAIREHSPSRAEQLERAVDSIGINIAEGYSRLHGRERARFYEYALGSAREAREWYARIGDCLPPGIALGRCRLLSRAIKILTVAVPQERAGSSERRIRDAADRRSPSGGSEKPTPHPAPVPARGSSKQH
jgi:hypothetical protein